MMIWLILLIFVQIICKTHQLQSIPFFHIINKLGYILEPQVWEVGAFIMASEVSLYHYY